MSSRIPWLRVSIEGAVIVGSILLAFGIDAWWDERDRKRTLEQDLSSVLDEIRDNRDLIDAEISALERVVSGGEAVLDVLDAGAEEAFVSLPDTLAFLVTYWAPTLDHSLGALDALTSSGRLSEVESIALRRSLAALRDRISDAVEDQWEARNFQSNRLLPTISSQVDLGLAYRIDREFFSSSAAAVATVERPLPTFGTVRFPTGVETRNAIAYRLSWHASALADMRVLRLHIDDLVELLGSG